MADDDKFGPGAWRSIAGRVPIFGPRGQPVENSTELTRILNLPRRPVVTEGSATAEALITLAQHKYGLPNHGTCRCAKIDPRRAEKARERGQSPCITRLLWLQAWLLHEITIANGLIANAAAGGGKCVHPDTEILDYATGRRRLAREVGDLRVASFDRTLSTNQAVCFASGRKQCVRVELADGSSVTTSTDHPILTARGWVEAAVLMPDDMVAVAAEMPEPTKHTIASDEEVSFVAYMLSDVGCSQSMMNFTNADTTVISDWSRCARELGYGITENKSLSKARAFTLTKPAPDRARGAFGSRFGRRVDTVRDRWDLHGLAKNKRAHADVWGLPRRQIALFLNRFWACDGHVSARGLEVTLTSEKLIDDVRFLLLRLGVRSRKAYKTASYVKGGVRHSFPAWRLTMRGQSALRFLREVGPVLSKESACSDLLAGLESVQRNTNTDLVPIGDREIGEICTELGLSTRARNHASPNCREVREFFGGSRKGWVSRDRFIKFCVAFNYRGKHSHLASTDVAWEPVSAVVPVGESEVFDLSVPGPKNFVANGIVVHNTFVWLLTPLALRNCPLSLLLIPSNLVQQIIRDYQLLAEHFRVPGIVVHLPGRKTWACSPKKAPNGNDEPMLHVLPYTRMSGVDNSSWIERLRPDAIIADEVDALADTESARTMRLGRYFVKYDDTRFVCGTGSLTNASIDEIWHLSLLALRDMSPLPQNAETVKDWGRCVDSVPNPCPAGALTRFLEPGEPESQIRIAYRRRLRETPGFVLIEGEQIVVTSSGEKVEIAIREREIPAVPEIVDRALGMIRNNVRPDTMGGADDDEVLVDELEKARCAREASTGVFYKFDFPPIDPATRKPHPRGVPQEKAVVKEWYRRRKAWNSELRSKMLRGEQDLDSPKLCENAARRAWGDLPKDPALPEWRAENWCPWRDYEDKVVPKHKAVRLHSFLADDAALWATQYRGIIWYSMDELAEWVVERAKELHGIKIPIHRGGANGLKALMDERGDRAILSSIKSNGRGVDGLQHIFSSPGSAAQYYLNIPASDRGWAQSLARLHRRGQECPEIPTWIPLHTREYRRSFENALRCAKYVEELTGEPRKLLLGWDGDLDEFDK